MVFDIYFKSSLSTYLSNSFNNVSNEHAYPFTPKYLWLHLITHNQMKNNEKMTKHTKVKKNHTYQNEDNKA